MSASTSGAITLDHMPPIVHETPPSQDLLAAVLTPFNGEANLGAQTIFPEDAESVAQITERAQTSMATNIQPESAPTVVNPAAAQVGQISHPQLQPAPAPAAAPVFAPASASASACASASASAVPPVLAPSAVRAESEVASIGRVASGPWSCPRCTLQNAPIRALCMLCRHPRETRGTGGSDRTAAGSDSTGRRFLEQQHRFENGGKPDASQPELTDEEILRQLHDIKSQKQRISVRLIKKQFNLDQRRATWVYDRHQVDAVDQRVTHQAVCELEALREEQQKMLRANRQEQQMAELRRQHDEHEHHRQMASRAAHQRRWDETQQDLLQPDVPRDPYQRQMLQAQYSASCAQQQRHQQQGYQQQEQAQTQAQMQMQERASGFNAGAEQGGKGEEEAEGYEQHAKEGSSAHNKDLDCDTKEAQSTVQAHGRRRRKRTMKGQLLQDGKEVRQEQAKRARPGLAEHTEEQEELDDFNIGASTLPPAAVQQQQHQEPARRLQDMRDMRCCLCPEGRNPKRKRPPAPAADVVGYLVGPFERTKGKDKGPFVCHKQCLTWGQGTIVADDFACGLQQEELGPQSERQARGTKPSLVSTSGEMDAGAFLNVNQTAYHAQRRNCAFCGTKGAALICKHPGCTAAYHLPCAIAANCELNIGLNTLAKVHKDTPLQVRTQRFMLCKEHRYTPQRMGSGPFVLDNTFGKLSKKVQESLKAQTYIVEKFVDSREVTRADGTGSEFLVKWLGFPSDQNTWEPDAIFVPPNNLMNSWRHKANAKGKAKAKVKTKATSKGKGKKY